MVSSSKSPRVPEKKRPREEEYRGMEQLDRPELDDVGDEEPTAPGAKPNRESDGDGEDWLNDTGIRRSPRSTPPPEPREVPVKAGSSA